MGYYIDDDSTDLDHLQTRLEATDLIPSQQALLEGLTNKMASLKKAGVQSLADLRIRLKSKKSFASLVSDSGIDTAYLVLLRRAVESFFPKPQPLKNFDWVDKDTLSKLERGGVKNTLQLYEAASSDIEELVGKAGRNSLSELLALSDLSRVQWVSPTFARTLVAAGFPSADKVGEADPEALCEAVMRANKDARFFKGTVGLRDIRRLITAASYVPLENGRV